MILFLVEFFDKFILKYRELKNELLLEISFWNKNKVEYLLYIILKFIIMVSK